MREYLLQLVPDVPEKYIFFLCVVIGIAIAACALTCARAFLSLCLNRLVALFSQYPCGRYEKLAEDDMKAELDAQRPAWL